MTEFGADEIYHRLISYLLNGGGLVEVANELADRLGQPVLVANTAGVNLAGELPPSVQTRFNDFIQRTWRDTRSLKLSFQTQALKVNLHLLPLLVNRQVEGFLVTEAVEFDSTCTAIFEQGATVATLALIQHQAVQETEQRLYRDLLEDLLTSERWSLGRLAEQARTLGWHLEAKPVVILLDFGEVRRRTLTEGGPDQPRLRWLREQFLTIVRQVLSDHHPLSIMVERGNGFILLPHLPTSEILQAQEQARQFVETLVQHIRAGRLNAGYAIACGGFHSGVEGLRQSFREAQQALEIGAQLLMRRPIWFDEVYLYLLLEHSSRNEDLRQWFKRTLSALVEYDLRNKTDMVHTLELYFDAGQKLHEAAQALHIHPNTLKYRLRRIEQVLGQDPFKGENQLRYYLATKVARLIQ